MRKFRIAGAALAGSATFAGLVALAQMALAPPALAQDGGPGPRLTFGLSQTFDFNDNLDLDVESEGNSTQSLTGLSFGLESETEISSLNFFAGTALRLLDGPNQEKDVEVDLDGTRVGLAYDRRGANTALSVDGLYTMDQIDTTLTLADFGPGDEVPEDFSDLQGTGMRRFYSLDAAMFFRIDDPVGYEIFAGASALDYTDTSDPDLFGNERYNAGAAMTAQINPVWFSRVGLSYNEFSSDNPDNDGNHHTGLDVDLTRELPNGNASLNLYAQTYEEDADNRGGFSLSRSMDLPAGALFAALGASKIRDQDPEVTGRISWTQDLPNGGLNLAANQAIRNDSDDNPQYVTGLRFGYSRDVDPLSQLGIDIGYARTEDVFDSDTTQSASFSAIYSRDLTEDWALDMGYTYRQRDEDDEGMARSNSVFLGLRRAWELRP